MLALLVEIKVSRTPEFCGKGPEISTTKILEILQILEGGFWPYALNSPLKFNGNIHTRMKFLNYEFTRFPKSPFCWSEHLVRTNSWFQRIHVLEIYTSLTLLRFACRNCLRSWRKCWGARFMARQRPMRRWMWVRPSKFFWVSILPESCTMLQWILSRQTYLAFSTGHQCIRYWVTCLSTVHRRGIILNHHTLCPSDVSYLDDILSETHRPKSSLFHMAPMYKV